MNYDVHEKQIDAFLNETNDIAIFGAGFFGMLCYDWLKALNHKGCVKYFLDNDVKKHNTMFYGLPVYSHEQLTKDSHATIIIASLAYKEIIKQLSNIGIPNKLLVFDERFPCYSDINEYKPFKAKDLYPYYNTSDTETKQALDYCIFLRNKYKGGAVYTPDFAHRVDYQEGYWLNPKLTLDIFEQFTFVDAGACTGDSFQELYDNYNHKMVNYYAFEPDSAYFKMLKTKVIKSGFDMNNATLYNYGIGDSDYNLSVSSENQNKSWFSLTNTPPPQDNGIAVQVVSIDSISLSVKGKLCLKMDIEGFEMKALVGATETIKKYKPELAICVYHKYEDIVDVPKFIKNIVPEYNCVLISGSNMVCFASVERFGASAMS